MLYGAKYLSMEILRRVFGLGLLLLACAAAHAGIDHELARDDRGIWARNNQVGLEYGAIVTEIAGALSL